MNVWSVAVRGVAVWSVAVRTMAVWTMAVRTVTVWTMAVRTMWVVRVVRVVWVVTVWVVWVVSMVVMPPYPAPYAPRFRSHVAHVVQVDESGVRFQASKILRDQPLVQAVLAVRLVDFVSRAEDVVSDPLVCCGQRCTVQQANLVRHTPLEALTVCSAELGTCCTGPHTRYFPTGSMVGSTGLAPEQMYEAFRACARFH